MTDVVTAGVIGGSGWLGGAIARAWLRSGCIAPERLWISNRSGSRTGFEDWSGVRFTTSNQELVEACDVVLLSVPPDLVPTLEIDAAERLVMSVMAGVTINAMRRHTGAARIARGMSNPAADLGLAYSPWCASAEATQEDRAVVRRLFEACGTADEVATEDQIDRFTALTGPVPGFAAYFAKCMVDYAVKHGVDPEVANRAIAQLFLASGRVLTEEPTTPAEHVAAMLDYAGTTAAGIDAMQASGLAGQIEQGLDAAYERTKSITRGG